MGPLPLMGCLAMSGDIFGCINGVGAGRGCCWLLEGRGHSDVAKQVRKNIEVHPTPLARRIINL